ncbi:S1 family peptidase [Yinghuangia seranimata]|uniref:S1 family peptidase n=1 Tax=Yinghuangia seranimata TaxID=408067 RepID=UPI00248BE166|nr:serine protease [Yinghuangia seranimata]MDI2125548.1 serine protease [Yinghuangia seranimata]
MIRLRLRSSGRALMGAVAAVALALVGVSASPAAAIRNGRGASIEQAPYTVILMTAEGVQLCGGTLVASDKVLTAAHCVTAVDDPTTLTVIAGRTDYTQAGGRHRQVVSAKVHPLFDQGTLTYDAAVLVLDRPLPYPTLPIAGPHDGGLYQVGRKATVFGWGAMDGGVPTTTLQRTTLVVSPVPACDPYTFPEDTAALKVCGLGPKANPGTSICRGDSGGPLVEDGKLIGIVSSGNKYCTDEQPRSAFTRASAIRRGLGL